VTTGVDALDYFDLILDIVPNRLIFGDKNRNPER